MPQATVAAIVTKEAEGARKILLTRRNVEPSKGAWCLPGGHIDQNETAKAAAVREVKEETGLDLDPEFFGYFDEILRERGTHDVVLVFTGSPAGEVSANPDEVSEIGWFSPKEALALPLAFTHNEVLAAYVHAQEGGVHS